MLADVDLYLVQTAHGTLYRRSGAIVFPGEPFVGVASANGHASDGASLGGWETAPMFTRATGSWTPDGDLTLHLHLDVAGER